MTHDDDHAEAHGSSRAPADARSVGIAPVRPFDPVAFESAVTALLKACGVDDAQLSTGHMRSTPRRVRELWQARLLGGAQQDQIGRAHV